MESRARSPEFKGTMPPLELPDRLLSLHTAELTERNDTYVIEIPSRELHQGDLQHGEMYKVALFPVMASEKDSDQPQESLQPPVQKGDIRVVEIEAIGQEGDGITKVERGYVIIVPGTEVGDEVTIEITNVVDNFAVGEVTSGRSGRKR